MLYVQVETVKVIAESEKAFCVLPSTDYAPSAGPWFNS